jgi:hypothetical protein
MNLKLLTAILGWSVLRNSEAYVSLVILQTEETSLKVLKKRSKHTPRF